MSSATSEVDFDGLEQSIRDRIAELSGRRQALAFDALSKTSAKTELQSIERKLAAAEGDLHRLDLARIEHARREQVAAEAETSEQRSAALHTARELQSQRQVAAVVLDEAAQAFAQAILGYFDVCFEQEAALRDGGWAAHWVSSARPSGYAVEAAFALALRDAGVQGSFERLPVIPPAHQKPLAEGDARPVQPLEDRDVDASD